MLAGLFFGLFPLLWPSGFAAFSGFAGYDPYIYRLAGAATLGYGVGLAYGLRRGDWAGLRLPVAGTLAFNIGSLYACAAELISPSTPCGGRSWVVVLILAAWVPAFLIVATTLATVFGLAVLLVPKLFQWFGFAVTDVFIYRQAGAATFGYAPMGIMELRSRTWREMRWAILMAAVFNRVSCLPASSASPRATRSCCRRWSGWPASA